MSLLKCHHNKKCSNISDIDIGNDVVIKAVKGYP